MPRSARVVQTLIYSAIADAGQAQETQSLKAFIARMVSTVCTSRRLANQLSGPLEGSAG